MAGAVMKAQHCCLENMKGLDTEQQQKKDTA